MREAEMKSIEERLKKAALGAGCLFLALGAFEMQSHAADAASQVQSRALLVTRGDYEGTEYDLTPGPQNDGVNVSRMLQNAYGGQNISITTEEKTKTKSELKKAIQTAFADSDADDVNYFYYSGHGQQDGLCMEMGRSRENVVTPQDLYDCFAGIEGKNVLIMDCCYSGTMGSQTRSIGLQSLLENTVSRDEAAETFVDQFTEGFAQAEKENQGFQSRTVLNSSRFRLLMAAADDELSNQVIRGDNSDIGDGGSENEEASAERTEPKQASAYGVFTGSLVYGNGIHAELAETDVDFEDATIGTAPADYDGDGEITFNEIRRFTQNHCVANHMRMYPSDNQEVFLPAAQKAEKASFEKAILHYAEDGTPKLQISYQARETLNAEVAWYYAGSAWGLQQLLFTVYDPEGLPDFEKDAGVEKVDGKSGISLKQGKGSFEITVGDEQTRYYSGYFACMIRTEGSDFSYIIPFAASAEDPSLINDMTLSAAEEHALSSEEEWELLADFGFYVSEEGSDAVPEFPIPLMSCRILDADGNTVRVLADQEMAEIVQPDGTGEYQCRAYFWWDCRDEKGNKVKAGTYTAVVTAEDASGSKTLEKEVKLAEDGSSETETESESETERETETQQPSTEAPNPNTGKETEKKDPAGNHTESTEKKEVQSISLVSRSAFSGQEKNGAKIVIGVRESVRLNPVITPADAADQRVTYKSSNNKVASVTQGGAIRAKKKGNAVITVTTANQKTCRIKVTVRQAPKKVTIGAKNRTLKKGKTFRLRVKLPSGSAAFGIRYNSSRKKIATVDAKGNVKAIRKGSTVITVKLYNGKKARLKLTVK